MTWVRVVRMAIIDSSCRALFDTGCDSVGFASGHPVMLITGKERKALAPEVMSVENVEKILAEILNKEQKETLAANKKIDFAYDAPAGGVKIVARYANNGVQVFITKKDAVIRSSGAMDGLLKELTTRGGSDLYDSGVCDFAGVAGV